MSDPEARPEPLRVPVVEVARRSSLVAAPFPVATSVQQSSVVLQRPVRIISDYPGLPSGPRASDTAVVHTKVAGPERQVSSADPLHRDSGSLGSFFSEAIESSLREARAASSLLDDAAKHSPHDIEQAGALDVQVEGPGGSLNEAIASTLHELEQSCGRADSPIAGSTQLNAHDLVANESQRVSEEEELDASSIEVSRPPPAPAAALRRSMPSNDVEITVSYGDEEAGENPRSSGEFEELEVDASSLRGAPGEVPSRAPPPPPPTFGRVSAGAESGEPHGLTRSARVAEARPSKPRSHPWWEVFFDDDYLRTVRPPTHRQIARQCDFIAKRLVLKPGATLLDVGCGLGLQVVELASRGYLSVGLDLSLAMLSRASDEAQSRGAKMNFLHADMRDMNFEGNFDAVMCIGTSLGYFDDETNKKVVERLFRALKPSGLLLLDVVNRDHVIGTQPNLVWFEGDGCVCMEESDFNFFTSRLHVKRTVILETGKQRENEYSLRLYSLHELGQLLHQSGFRVIEVSGREALPGVFFGQESPNMMVVAERRPTGDTAPLSP